MSDLRDLYQEELLDHYGKPRNFRKIDNPTKVLEGYNPLCGDRYTVYLSLEGDVISDIAFQGSGCAISKASGSLMTENLKGKTKAEAEELFDAFHHMLTRGPGEDFDEEKLGDLEILAGVVEFPMRVKCATLAWHTLRGALRGQEDSISTE
jgi:nitrogen fixation NifU-like protein